jgi:hypothetical protein
MQSGSGSNGSIGYHWKLLSVVFLVVIAISDPRMPGTGMNSIFIISPATRDLLSEVVIALFSSRHSFFSGYREFHTSPLRHWSKFEVSPQVGKLFNFTREYRGFGDVVLAGADGAVIGGIQRAAGAALGDLFAHDFAFADECGGESCGAAVLGCGGS